jgi:hypothetical protein
VSFESASDEALLRIQVDVHEHDGSSYQSQMGIHCEHTDEQHVGVEVVRDLMRAADTNALVYNTVS